MPLPVVFPPPSRRLLSPLRPTSARATLSHMGSVIEVRRLRKRYGGEAAPIRALRGVDLTVEEGEFVAVMGPSGCGKSTLLNLVAGLDRPTDGEVVLVGESLAGKGEDELARLRRVHVGFVFQFFNLLEGMTA